MDNCILDIKNRMIELDREVSSKEFQSAIGEEGDKLESEAIKKRNEIVSDIEKCRSSIKEKCEKSEDNIDYLKLISYDMEMYNYKITDYEKRHGVIE